MITCNAGIKLCPHPDFYLAVDQISSREHEDAARKAQRSGTRLVTLARDLDAQGERHIDHFDLAISEDPKALPHVGGYGRFRYSGPLMLEVALNHGATEIHLVGFDGYDPDRPMYFDQSERDWNGEASQRDDIQRRAPLFHQVAQEAFGRIARAWAHCRFVQHGPTTFQVAAPNWRRACDPDAA